MAENSPESRKQHRGCIGAFLRVFLIILAGLLVIGIVGALYESWASKRVAQRYVAPGELYEVKGRTMHLHCMGEGAPTVLLDAGQGGWSIDWGEITPQIADRTRVCAYDRAGYGWSEVAQDDRSPQALADDLEQLLASAGMEPPFLLVGFSHAALGNRIFAASNADALAGMVLIDPATEFDNEILGPDLLQQQRSAVGLFQGFGLLARLGVVRLLDPANMAGSAPFIATDPVNPDLYYAFVADPQWWETSASEFGSRLNDENLAMVRDLGAVPEIPFAIIGSDVSASGTGPAMSEAMLARQERLAALAANSPQGEYIVAEGSTHNVLNDRPDLIVERIHAMLD